MNQPSISQLHAKLPPAALLLSPLAFHVTAEDRRIFEGELCDFIPSEIFDVHAHLYDFGALASALDLSGEAAALLKLDELSATAADYQAYVRQESSWMGDRVAQGGLFFGYPTRTLDTSAANDFLRHTIKDQPASRGLLLIRPDDDPAVIEEQVVREGWAGFKVYHIFAPRQDTQNCEIGEFLPDWAWDIANRLELAIMLHMVRPRSLADKVNQKYIREYCVRYPGAKLVLAHAARGFNARHTVEGIHSIAGLPNVYFDTSAVCEPQAFEAILQTFGPTRLMYGSDFPVSEAHGRCISVGDGFHWIYDFQQESWGNGEPVLVGIESLLALKRACQAMSLSESDAQLIFQGNAHALLKMGAPAPREQDLYRHAKTILPGGTQLLSKRPEMYAPEVWPPYFREARGCEIITHDGKRLIDFTTNGIGSCLLGFAHPHVSEAVLRRVHLGAMSTLNPPEEVELAEKLLALHPWAQQARFARAGGEALAVAARIARSATGRDVIAFCGYHGWHDWYLAANLSGDSALTGHLMPGLAPTGVPSNLQGTAFPFASNDLEALKEIGRKNPGNVAAVIMEPARSADPEPGFLEGVREFCRETGARLVFDEVTAGFRFHPGGLHMKYGVEPDLAVFAKALGNGHPIAAVIGRRDTMSAAEGSFISSTYWTDSVGPAAALATLEVMGQVDIPAHVAKIGSLMREGLASIAVEAGLSVKIGGFPALTTFAIDHPENAALITLYTARMLESGFLAGSGFYPTLAHTPEIVREFLAAARPVLEELAQAAEKGDVSSRLQTPVKHGGFARLN